MSSIAIPCGVEPADRLGDRARGARGPGSRPCRRRSTARSARELGETARSPPRHCAGSSSLTSIRSPPTRSLSSSERALGDQGAVVDDRDPVGQAVGLVEVLGGQQHGACPGRRAPRSPPRGRSGCAGRGRSSARRGTAPAGGRPAPRRGRGGGACRRSRSSPAGRRPRRGRSARAAAAPARATRPRAQVVEPADHLEVLEPGQVLVDGRVLAGEPDLRRAARPRRLTTSRPATRALPPVGGSSVVRIRTAVVLPAPFGPSRPSTVPVSTCRSIPHSASTSL